MLKRLKDLDSERCKSKYIFMTWRISLKSLITYYTIFSSYHDIEEEEFLTTLTEVLKDPKYSQVTNISANNYN